MAILSPASRVKKTHVKFLLATRLPSRACHYAISIVDDQFNYAEVFLNIKTQMLTYNCAHKISKLLIPWIFDSASEIVILDNIALDDPLNVYFEVANRNIFANMKRVSIDQIVKRVATYHPTYVNKRISDITAKSCFSKLWDKLVKNEPCPWISRRIDNELKMLPNSKQRPMKQLKVATYYAVIRRHMMRNV